MSLSFFERTSTGELMSRVSNDVNALEQFITHGTILTGVAALRLVGSAVVLLVLDWRLALVALLPVPLIALGLRWFNRRARPIYRRVRDRLGDVNARLQDDLAGIRVIQAFGQEDAELDRFSAVSQRYLNERIASIGTWSTFFPALGFLTTLGGALVLGVGARMVLQDRLTLGTLVAFLSYIVAFYEPIRRLTDIDNILQQAAAAAERVFELLDQTPEIRDAPDAVALERVTGEVAFEDVMLRLRLRRGSAPRRGLPRGAGRGGRAGRSQRRGQNQHRQSAVPLLRSHPRPRASSTATICVRRRYARCGSTSQWCYRTPSCSMAPCAPT